MLTTVAPKWVIPIETMPGGGVANPTMEFAGDPAALFVSEQIWGYPWYRVLQWHAPTIATVLMIGALVFVAARVLRVWNRPRRAGALYCRGCNHELSLPQAHFDESAKPRWKSEDARCPECGVRTEKPPVAGRSWVKRLAPAVLLLLIAGGSSAWILATTLQPARGGVAFGVEPTWPTAGIEKLAGWAALRRTMSTDDLRGMRVMRIDLATGERRTLLRVSKPARIAPGVTPNGEWVAQLDARGGGMLWIVQASTGSVREVRWHGGFIGEVVGFSSDSRRAYLSRQIAANAQRTVGELWCVELESGDAKAIACVEFDHPGLPFGAPRARPRFVVIDDERGLDWVHHQVYGAGPARVDVFRRMKEGAIEAIEVHGNRDSMAEVAVLNEDRSAVEFSSRSDDAVFAIDLRQAQVSGIRARPLAEWDGRRFLFWTPSGFEVRRWGGQSPLVSLETPVLAAVPSRPIVSSNGRYVAAFLVRSETKQATGSGPATSKSVPEIRIWDMISVPGDEFEWSGFVQPVDR